MHEHLTNLQIALIDHLHDGEFTDRFVLRFERAGWLAESSTLEALTQLGVPLSRFAEELGEIHRYRNPQMLKEFYADSTIGDPALMNTCLDSMRYYMHNILCRLAEDTWTDGPWA